MISSNIDKGGEGRRRGEELFVVYGGGGGGEGEGGVGGGRHGRPCNDVK